MARPLTRAQALENAAFLKALRRSGNIRLAAREVDVKYGTIQHRRRAHPHFALAITQAIAWAQARLHRAGGRHGPSSTDKNDERALRTRGGEPVVVRLKSGLLQLRRAQPGKLTRQGEQAFLSALAATANVSLAAAAAGAAEAAFYRRKRRNPSFAREMKLALQEGYEKLEMALLENYSPAAFEDDAWRHNERPTTPPMTVSQALQLMYLHQKECRLLAEPEYLKRRRGESRAAHDFRLHAMGHAENQAQYDRFCRREAAFRVSGVHEVHTPPVPVVVDLSQVTGWSRAKPDGGGEHHPNKALFGGWRMGDVEHGKRGKSDPAWRGRR